MCSKLPATFTLFSVHGYAHAQLSSLYPLSTFITSHVRKNIRLSTPAQLQCLHSGAGSLYDSRLKLKEQAKNGI